MAYDAENLYFAFKCFDKEPDKIKAAMAARDTIRSDVGYLTRQGVTDLFGSLTPKFYPKSRFVGGVTYKPSERFDLTGSLTFSDLYRESTKEKEFYLWRL